VTPEKDPKFEALLEYLQRARGFDFSAYKRSSLMRRVEKRMQLIKLADFEGYMDYLEVHPEEFAHLFDTILINVTSFFRDKPAWDRLADEILPRLLAGKPPNDPVRVWSAGCASGEEAYTLAILLAEALGEDAFQRRVKIYASDVDEQALAQARAASYTPAQLEAVPEPLRGKYFTANGERCVFRTDLRRSIIFGRHDLVQDAPISRLDLLVCRNTLMYLNSETQAKILARFHFALSDSGFLFLGKAEMLLTHTNLFVPVDLRSRIFAKTARANPRDRLLLMAQGGETEAVNQLARHVRLREEAFIASPVAQLVVDLSGAVVLINDRMRSLFNLDSRDVGRPLQDLEISYRPLELRSLVDQARIERRAVTVPNVDRRLATGEPQYFDVVIVPLLHNGDNPLGIAISFSDVTRYHQLQADLQRSNQELETANEELQSAHEELETTNEELQSTNEELETTNEELQSTNEELETMNEELQSTNEELETINAELRDRTTALDSANLFLHAILTSLRTGVVVVDRQLNVMIWNYRAEDLWGLRSDEVLGKSLLHMDIGLAVRQLEAPIRRLLHGEAKDGELVLDAHDRRGRQIRCRITCTPLGGDRDGGIPGVVLLMSDQEPSGAEHSSGDSKGSGS
jgi:two-component system CheB/CheR fusion protein